MNLFAAAEKFKLVVCLEFLRLFSGICPALGAVEGFADQGAVDVFAQSYFILIAVLLCSRNGSSLSLKKFLKKFAGRVEILSPLRYTGHVSV